MIELRNSDLESLINRRNQITNGEKYFLDFLIALLKVESHYMIWPYGLNDNDSQVGERVFAYEFYHQWRKVSDQFHYENLIINGEIRKDGSIYRHDNLGQVYPDLILHEQQNNMNQQRIACEIKTSKAINHTNGRKHFKRDLLKLSQFHRELRFEYCIFLQIMDLDNCLASSIIPYLLRIQEQLSDLDSIYLIIKDYDIVKYDTLQNIIINAA
ncbi:hypothetical protein ACE01N_19965 [Saccharicrinis sp. FJH2]|uniref:hypothetical protein n=1 Tax=Saccharicrinis sp. FJH65 TaxID=3344659 RepID=UPI0035F221D5